MRSLGIPGDESGVANKKLTVKLTQREVANMIKSKEQHQSHQYMRANSSKGLTY